MIALRPSCLADDNDIADVAVSSGQTGVDTGSDAVYLASLRARGTLVVAVADGRVVGYAASIEHDTALILTDLFVLSTQQGRGTGHALLEAVLPRTRPRITFASRDPRAIALYLRQGLRPVWPLLYLHGPSTPSPPRMSAEPVDVTEGAALIRRLTGLDRRDAFAHWAARPDAQALVVRVGRRVTAVSVAHTSSAGHVLTHLTAISQADADASLRTALSATGGTWQLCLPGPHPTAAGLLAAGYRITDVDTHMATPLAELPPCNVYSPGLG
jgi:GNAT superfamily N-acetyltransferase